MRITSAGVVFDNASSGAELTNNTIYQPAGTKAAIAQILRDEGFIESFERLEGGPQGTIRIALRYGPEKEKIITGLRRISRPGLRVYTRADHLPRVLGGLGVAVLSTSHGLMTDREARQRKIGGEVLCYVW